MDRLAVGNSWEEFLIDLIGDARREKVRENPNNKRSKVTGFRFYPVYQPQFRDEELEGKELQAKVTACLLYTSRCV